MTNSHLLMFVTNPHTGILRFFFFVMSVGEFCQAAVSINDEQVNIRGKVFAIDVELHLNDMNDIVT